MTALSPPPPWIHNRSRCARNVIRNEYVIWQCGDSWGLLFLVCLLVMPPTGYTQHNLQRRHYVFTLSVQLFVRPDVRPVPRLPYATTLPVRESSFPHSRPNMDSPQGGGASPFSCQKYNSWQGGQVHYIDAAAGNQMIAVKFCVS